MKHKLLGMVLPLAIALVPSSADASRHYSTSGVACEGAFAGQQSCLTRNQYGIQNICGSEVTVECPVNPSVNTAGQPVVSFFGFQGYDRNPSTDVNCDLQRIDANGGITYTANIKTSGSAAGTQGLLISPNTIVQGVWRLRCAMPAVSSGNFSHLVSYGMVTNETMF
jgi:hypothetical protein